MFSTGRQFNEHLEQVGQYVSYKGLGRSLKKKIIDYYQFKYSRGKYFDEAKILNELNTPLRLVGRSVFLISRPSTRKNAVR